MSTQIARAQSLPKTHKHYEQLPVENQHEVKDSFSKMEKITDKLKESFDDKYHFILGDAESLFLINS